MKRFLGIALALFATAVLGAGAVWAAERTVVLPKTDQPFKVRMMDIVRLTGQGIAGSKITADVTGPAKIENTNHVIQKSGTNPIIGSNITEFEIKPTGKGKVQVKITVQPPQPGSTPKITTYEFEVE
jgi:hypothetical protein